jgi:hypothetical protein
MWWNVINVENVMNECDKCGSNVVNGAFLNHIPIFITLIPLLLQFSHSPASLRAPFCSK